MLLSLVKMSSKVLEIQIDTIEFKVISQESECRRLYLIFSTTETGAEEFRIKVNIC